MTCVLAATVVGSAPRDFPEPCAVHYDNVALDTIEDRTDSAATVVVEVSYED